VLVLVLGLVLEIGSVSRDMGVCLLDLLSWVSRPVSALPVPNRTRVDEHEKSSRTLETKF
jgi:hypothetical protein